jgi:hypothetical protein
MPTSIYLANRVLDNELAGAFLSLHTADPGRTGASEVVGGSYARKAVTLSAASGGATSNSGEVLFDGMPAVTVTHAALWTLVSGGNCLWTGALTASKVVAAGDEVKVKVGDLDVTLT